MEQDIPELAGRRVFLRQARAGDVSGRMVLGNTAEIQRMFGAEPVALTSITENAARRGVNTQIDELAGWVIATGERLIGSVPLHAFHRRDRRAGVAIGILDPALLGQGLGFEALRLIYGFAFDALGLHRLAVRVLAFKARAIAAYRNVGFVEEAREREAALIGTGWHDDVIMGLLAPEFERVRGT